MIDAICFDLDGTLFDDRQYVRAGLEQGAKELYERRGVDLTEQLLEAYFHRGVRHNVFDTVLEEAGVSRDVVPELVSAYHDNDADLDPFSDAVDTLEALHRDYALGLITGGTNGREKLRRLGLQTWFQVVVVTAERADTKADPDPFEDAVEALDAEPERTVYVGDRPGADFPQPNRLGMHTVRVRRGQYAGRDASGESTPNVTVEALHELPAVVERLDDDSGSS